MATRLNPGNLMLERTGGQQADLIRTYESGARGQVPLAHRESLARALGKIVASIDEKRPKAALKRIMQGLGPEKATTLAHRKRIILFPGEGLPKAHVWSATWAEYLGLARRALEQLAGEKASDARAAYVNRALLRLIKIGRGAESGSSAPAAEAAPLLETWAATMASRIGETTKIETLWQELDRAPFTVVEQVDSSDSSFLTEAARAAEALLESARTATRPRFAPVSMDSLSNFILDFGAPVRLRGSSIWLTKWARPSIRLGWVAYEARESVFVLPARFARQLDSIELIPTYPPELDWDSAPDALAWLESVGGGDDWAPDIEYTKESGFGWFENKFYGLARISLMLEPGEDW